MNTRFSNAEIVTLAVYLLGGEWQYIDTEDIAVKANHMAPGRFTWKKYNDRINIEHVRTFLSDSKKAKNGSYLLGSGKEGWMLTENGLKFAKKRIINLKNVDLSRERFTAKEKQWIRSERERMLNSDAFHKFMTGGLGEVSLREAQNFFRIDDYVVGKIREQKILRVLNRFNDDPELGTVVKELVKKIRGDDKSG